MGGGGEGVAILWPSNVNFVVLPCPQFRKRCCAVKVTVNNCSFILINVYFPNDNFSNNVVTEELRDVVDSLETFMLNVDADFIVIAGDFNIDLRRCNAHSKFLGEFCERMHLSLCVNFMSHSISYTRSCNGIYSLIDHFFISSDMVSSDICKRYYVCDDCIVNDVNLSDHDLICLSLSLPFFHPVLLSAKSAPLSRSQVNWHKASTYDIANFQSTVHDCVNMSRCNAACGSLCCGGCSEANHLRDIDLLADHAHRLLGDSAFRCIPHSRFVDHAVVVPGWSDICAELRKQSLHWHRIWADCGRPQAGAVADIMRASRKKYHWSVLQVRKHEVYIRNEKVAEALVLGGCVNFWREVN